MIEVPSGLIDPGETAEQCAVRELKEETGYVGVTDDTSVSPPVMFNGECPVGCQSGSLPKGCCADAASG